MLKIDLKNAKGKVDIIDMTSQSIFHKKLTMEYQILIYKEKRKKLHKCLIDTIWSL